MLQVNGDKFSYYIDNQVKDDLTGNIIMYKKLIWTKTKVDIQKMLTIANNSLVNENSVHDKNLIDINNNIAFWQGLYDEANQLVSE